jgi:hypothetical protein
MFILLALARSDNQHAIRALLRDGYMTVFNDKSIEDFNVVFNELRQRDYVSTCGLTPGDDCLITGHGLTFFQKYRKYFEQKRKGGGIPSFPPEIRESYKIAKSY